MKMRDLCREIGSSNHGDLWDRAYKWLETHNEIVDYWKMIPTKGGNQKTHMVGIKRHEAWE
jgi:hypothetical protein